MSNIRLDSPFVSYDMGEEEAELSKILGDLNRQMIQNLLFEATMEKVNLEWTKDTEAREKVLAGKIEVLRLILDNHDVAFAESSRNLKTSGHPTIMQEGLPIHQIFPRPASQHPGIRMPDGEIIRPDSTNPSES